MRYGRMQPKRPERVTQEVMFDYAGNLLRYDTDGMRKTWIRELNPIC